MIPTITGAIGSAATALGRLLGRGLYTEPLPVPARKKSIAIRHLDGGSSNLAELELVALTNPIYDLARYGIHFVAAPPHADLLLVTGPLTWNMLGPAQETFAVMHDPKWIVTLGDFADFAGRGAPSAAPELVDLFAGSYAVTTLPDEMRAAIIAHIPGDPPDPAAIAAGLLADEVDLWNPVPLSARAAPLGGARPPPNDGGESSTPSIEA